MAGSQQQQIADTIFSMKRRILRKDDSSDSETDSPYGGRRQNLKRKAHYTRSGDAEFLSDARLYKKRIEHAGYNRHILHRNPPRYDQDGDIVEPGDEEEDEDELSPVEEDPYADIRLENLLAPLTSAAELPNHPSMSIAYTSKHLTNLTIEAGAISRKEQSTLWQAKNIFNRLQGDSAFVPSAIATMSDEPLEPESWVNGSNNKGTNGAAQQVPRAPEGSVTAPDVEMTDAGHLNSSSKPDTNIDDSTKTEKPNGTEPKVNGTSHNGDSENPHQNGDKSHSPAPDDAASDTASQQTSHRMTTRARAQAATDPSPPDSPSSTVNPVHPFFMFSSDSIPDRDMGLPASEAEETRMLLMAYVQKQEEISRAATDLFMGMSQGERMRQDMFKWAKAEAHVGEMSDGEDWYDREEWMLEGDLIKGRDEEDEDGAAGGGVAGKKATRQRRKPDKEDR